MASPNFAQKNPFMGMTVAEMKNYYDKKVRGKKLTLEQKKNLANQMQAAKKAAPKAKPAASKPAASKPAAKPQMPGGTNRAALEKSFNKAKAVNNFVGPGGSRTREDLKRSEAEYKKSQKPKRSNYPAGRGGQAKYAAALRNYNRKPAKPRRAALTMAQRRRARRSSR